MPNKATHAANWFGNGKYESCKLTILLFGLRPWLSISFIFWIGHKISLSSDEQSSSIIFFPYVFFLTFIPVFFSHFYQKLCTWQRTVYIFQFGQEWNHHFYCYRWINFKILFCKCLKVGGLVHTWMQKCVQFWRICAYTSCLACCQGIISRSVEYYHDMCHDWMLQNAAWAMTAFWSWKLSR